MSRLKYLSFFLALSFMVSSCFFNFNDKKEEEVVNEKENEDVIRIEINGEDMEIDADELEEEISSSVNKIVSEITSSLEGIGNEWKEKEEVEMMDHRKLKSLLPDRLGWMTQTEHSSEKTGVLGFRVATAEARYELRDKWIEIELVDLGGMPIARIGLSFWDEIEVDRESKDEYEKTYEKNGNKYHEQYNKKHKEGELKAVFKDRYVLSIKGENVKLSDLENARDKVKINKLD